MEPSYAFSVDVADEVGAISTIAVILAAKGISIKNIGINNNRERGGRSFKDRFLRRSFHERCLGTPGKIQVRNVPHVKKRLGISTMEFTQSGPLRGELTVPGDKSISHRAVMLGSIAKGLTEIRHFLRGADCLSTISCF